MERIYEQRDIPLSSTVILSLTVGVGNMTRARYDAKVARFAACFQKAWKTLPVDYRRVIVRWLRKSVAHMGACAFRFGCSQDALRARKVFLCVEVGTSKRPKCRRPLAEVSGRNGDIWFPGMMMDAPENALLYVLLHELLHMYFFELFPERLEDPSDNDPVWSDTHISIFDELSFMVPDGDDELYAWRLSRKRVHKGEGN